MSAISQANLSAVNTQNTERNSVNKNQENNNLKATRINKSSIIFTLAKATYTLALPIMALNALTSIPTTEGGPITYSACVAGCEALATGATAGVGSIPAIQACLYACLPLLTSPTP